MQAWQSKTFIAFDIFLYMASRTGPSWLGPEKIFVRKVIRLLENAILRLVYAS